MGVVVVLGAVEHAKVNVLVRSRGISLKAVVNCGGVLFHNIAHLLNRHSRLSVRIQTPKPQEKGLVAIFLSHSLELFDRCWWLLLGLDVLQLLLVSLYDVSL